MLPAFELENDGALFFHCLSLLLCAARCRNRGARSCIHDSVGRSNAFLFCNINPSANRNANPKRNATHTHTHQYIRTEGVVVKSSDLVKDGGIVIFAYPR